MGYFSEKRYSQNLKPSLIEVPLFTLPVWRLFLLHQNFRCLEMKGETVNPGKEME